jgi:Arc/MetJ-type ribon-helix-helix transcriptional regulator
MLEILISLITQITQPAQTAEKVSDLKSLRISEDVHQKLTGLLGELTAQTKKTQTYQDAIEALLKDSVLLPPELLAQTESFVEENRQLGFTTKEELIRDAVRYRLTMLKGEYQFIEVPKEEYDQLEIALEDMNAPYRSTEEFVIEQMREALEKYEEWKRSRKKH